MYSNISIVLTDEKRQIQWVNHDFSLMTGYSMQEVLGKKPSILQGKNTDQKDIQLIKKYLDAKIPFKHKVVNYTKEQEEYNCCFTIFPIMNENKELTNYIAFEVNTDIVDESTIPVLQLKERYQTSSLKKSDQMLLYAKLCALMQNDKLYLIPDLTLKVLANLLKTNTRYLSQVINSFAGINLQLFINTYRIQAVKQKMIEEEANLLTLYGIAQQCGFKNKSTFYKVFKEIIGKTPKDFIKNQNLDKKDSNR
jgi:PAS domain S-box-containing protein